MKKSHTSKLDTLMGQMVRQKGYCEKCGNKETLQACHIFTRKIRGVRWSPLNLLCLCASCHRFAHDRPTQFSEWVIPHLGKTRYELLKQKASRLKPFLTYEDVKFAIENKMEPIC